MASANYMGDLQSMAQNRAQYQAAENSAPTWELKIRGVVPIESFGRGFSSQGPGPQGPPQGPPQQGPPQMAMGGQRPGPPPGMQMPPPQQAPRPRQMAQGPPPGDANPAYRQLYGAATRGADMNNQQAALQNLIAAMRQRGIG